MSLKDVSKCAVLVSGVQSVTAAGTTGMLVWCADNWDMHTMVIMLLVSSDAHRSRKLMNLNIGYNSLTILHAILQEPLQDSVPTSGIRPIHPSDLPVLCAQEVSSDSLTALTVTTPTRPMTTMTTVIS